MIVSASDETEQAERGLQVMSVDRYFAIVYPLRRRPGRNATVSIIAIIWVLAVLSGTPAFFASKMEYHYFLDELSGRVFEDRLCLADNFPDGNSGTSKMFSM